MRYIRRIKWAIIQYSVVVSVDLERWSCDHRTQKVVSCLFTLKVPQFDKVCKVLIVNHWFLCVLYSFQIVKSYRKKALKCHPDKNPDNPKAGKNLYSAQLYIMRLHVGITKLQLTIFSWKFKELNLTLIFYFSWGIPFTIKSAWNSYRCRSKGLCCNVDIIVEVVVIQIRDNVKCYWCEKYE